MTSNTPIPGGLPELVGTSRATDDPDHVVRLLFKSPVDDKAKTRIGLIIAGATYQETWEGGEVDTEQRCPACLGNDKDTPCAYPSEQQPGCLRDARLMKVALKEKAAQAIYEHHSFGLDQGIPIEGKPVWVPNGNSLKQREARDYAEAALAVAQTGGDGHR